MKKIIAILVLFFATQNLTAQFDTLEIKQNIYAASNAMLNAFRGNDWPTFVQSANEKVIEFAGGKEALANLLDSTMKGLFAEGGKIDTTYVGRVLQVVKTPAGYQAIIESFMQMTISGFTVSGSSYDIGVSKDGKEWKFLRIEDNSTFKPVDFIPGLSPKLKLPKSQFVPGTTVDEFLKTYKLNYASGEPAKEKKPRATMVPSKASKPAKPKTRS